MTTFLLTCGISSLINLRHLLVRERVEAVEEAAEQARIHRDLDRAADLSGQVRDLAGAARGHSTERLCVEKDSLYFARGCPLPERDDRIVLLASDSSDGVLAAMLVAALCDRDARLQGGVGPGDHPVDVRLAPPEAASPARPVNIVRVAELVPERDTFREAMGRVARAVAWAGSLEQAGQGLVLHVAGGFKATIPFVVAMAEYLPDLLGRSVSMYCLHERSEGVSTRIPLRRADLAGAMRELDQAASNPTRAPDPATLRDWAWEVEAGRVRLTVVGEALRALFEEARSPRRSRV